MIRYYVRVSTEEQKVDRQLIAFDGADKIYIDKMTGADINRPELQAMLQDLEKGDTVVVKSLDRLSRSTLDLLSITKEIEEKGAFLKVLDRNIDTSDPIGKFFLTMLGAVAELERANIKQRTKEGIEIAKKKGRYMGRKAGSIELKKEDIKQFKKFYNLGMSKTDLATQFKVARSTIYRWIKELKARGEIK